MTFDFISFEENPMDGALVYAKTYRDPALRNDQSSAAKPKRMVLHFAGAAKGTATLAPIPGFEGRVSTDFSSINDGYAGRHYCIFYAVQWHYANSTAYADKGIVKHNVCTGERQAWVRKSQFPSEPKFVPDPRGQAEDDGTLLFTVLDGATQKSTLRAVDARTMQEVARSQTVPPIGFTTHGQFYPELR